MSDVHDVVGGVLLTVLLHALQIPIAWLTGSFYGIMFMGVSQLIYIVPAVALAYKNRPDIAKGLIIGASITFLLNAACFGFLFVSSRSR